jgi:hemerythrin-like domain-containing protein
MFIQIGTPPDHTFNEPLGLLTDCHRRIERFLTLLMNISAGFKGAALSADAARQFAAALDYFATAAPLHTADEEDSLFPRLRQAAAAEPRIARLVERLGRDHGEVAGRHAAVDVLGRRWLSQGTLEEAAVAELIAHLEILKAMYDEHIGLEDRELFQAAARLLSSSTLSEIAQEMSGRRRR